MATTQNRTFFGGSTAPGSGVYPEDVKNLKVYRNYAESQYDPLANSDTSIYIPTVEKVDASGASIHVTIQKILASGGYPVLVYHNEEYQYITTDGTPSKYVFMCLSDLSTFKRAEVDVATGAVSVSSSTTAAVQYIGRSSHNIYNKISNAIAQNTLPVIVDDSAYYQLSYAWNGMTRFTRVDETDGTIHILSIDRDDTITETVVSAGAGGTIYPSLQSAIADASNLAVGAIFETNGFHTSGDGGAARYVVSDTGTANGMDIVQLAAGKLAVLQVGREAFVEQIGYEPKSSAANASDLTPYLQRLFAMNVYRIKFKATYLYYYMKTPLEINKHDVEFIGGLDKFSGYSSRIEYIPNNDVTEDYCFRLNARRIKFKHLYINDNPTRTHICFKTDNPSGNHEGYIFEGLNVSLFDIAFSLCGSVNWQHTFNRVTFNQCRIGLYTQNTFFMNNLTECYFSCLEKDVFSESEYNAVTFTNCNFECLNTCVHFSYWKEDPNLASKLFTLTDAKFICCSFEFHTPQDVPSNVQGCFIYVDDFVQAKLNLDTQNLSLKKLADTNPAVTNTTCFSFGENTYCTFVSVRGQDYTSYWASKFLWDESRHPAIDIGAITIVNSYNIPRPSFGDLYLPTFRGNDGVIFFSNSTNILVNYPSLKDGDTLFNLDDGCYYTKSADQLVKASDSPSNFVRIGDELYNYVVIGTKKWITRNLRLQTTNSKVLFKKETGLKEEWGLYYPFGDRAELSAKLPTGWRIPTKTDLDDLISSLPGANGTEKAHNAQSTQYPSVFPNATNSSGLNIPPSQQYDSTSYVRGYFMSNTSKYTLVVNENGILEYDITPDYPNLISPIRVCADV